MQYARMSKIFGSSPQKKKNVPCLLSLPPALNVLLLSSSGTRAMEKREGEMFALWL